MVWLALGIVYVVWGSTYLAIAYVVDTLPVFTSAGVRFAVAGAILALWIAARDRAALRVDRRQLGGAVLVGTLLLAGGNGLVSLGERTVASGLAALVIASVPLWIVLLRLAVGERVRRDVVIGVVAGIVGVAILVVPDGVNGTTDPFGLAALVCATLLWAIGTFLSPRLSMPRSALASTALQMLGGGAVLVVIGLALGEAGTVDPTRFATSSLVAWSYLVVVGSLVAFSAYTWLLQNAPVSLVATYAYVNPVVAVFLGTLFRSEPITPTMLVGAALILAAVAFIVSRTSTRGGAPAVRRASASR